MTQKNKWYHWVMLIGVLFLLGAAGGCESSDNGSFISNTLMTTIFGPPWADIIVIPSNFLPCKGGPIALCYYSGPTPETCELTKDGKLANCKCFEIPYGKYFVDMNAILNLKVYLETVNKCGKEGRNCSQDNDAPVCQFINQNLLFPGADLISTFSFTCVPELGIGMTDCTTKPFTTYAGCMTAPCKRSDTPGIVNCSCPTFTGPHQLGQNLQSCTLNDNLVWSAAYNPLEAQGEGQGGKTYPVPPAGCIPDAPVTLGGCPLLKDPMQQPLPTPPPDVECGRVCKEYKGCLKGDTEIGFTCDATLCTSSCTDTDLVKIACSGLQPPQCEISEIAKLESEVGCSCCASQICGCELNEKTNAAIFDLNDRQRMLNIKPQCDINGTLCGVQP